MSLFLKSNKMMLKAQIQEELKQIDDFYSEIHLKYSVGDITQEKYILMLVEHLSLVRAYRKVLETKRIKLPFKKVEEIV